VSVSRSVPISSVSYDGKTQRNVTDDCRSSSVKKSRPDYERLHECKFRVFCSCVRARICSCHQVEGKGGIYSVGPQRNKVILSLNHTVSSLPLRKVSEIPYILECNPHPFYSFRELKNQMAIRIACGLDSRSRAGVRKNDSSAVRAVRTIQ